jgi:hypothetical protein
MLKSRLTTFSKIAILFLPFTYTAITWCVNLYKLLHCDFVGPWRKEIIHTLGLMPGVSWFTAWM